MRGAADALKRDRERVLYGAWATERFAREDNLRAFPHYAKAMLPQEKAKPQTPREALAVFEALRASGVPMTIRRVA
ncbi:hypothetical protein [Sphingomonas hankookensis]|uniref:hypothetical protein n=1 Tax=Sphingomonas hankookensis TaxID=563996 RepID=UPI003D302770